MKSMILRSFIRNLCHTKENCREFNVKMKHEQPQKKRRRRKTSMKKSQCLNVFYVSANSN